MRSIILNRRNLYRRHSPSEYHPHVLFWKRKVLLNGGTISSRTLKIVNSFYKELRTLSFFNKIKVLNPVIPDSKWAFQIPLIDSTGLYYWTNINDFQIENGGFQLNINGAKSNNGSSAVALSTQFVPSNQLGDIQSFGGTIYLTETAETAGSDCVMGASDIFRNASFLMEVNNNFYTPGTYSDVFICYDQANLTTVASSNFTGYISMNRLSNTSAKLFKASSTVNHTMYAENTNADPGSLPTNPIAIFVEAYGATYINWMAEGKRISFIALHLGLTEAESAIFYRAIQKYRRRIGGGFV
jgi:hypothetical protein